MKTLPVVFLILLLTTQFPLRCDQERERLLDAYCERMVKAVEPLRQKEPDGIDRCLEKIQRLMISDPFISSAVSTPTSSRMDCTLMERWNGANSKEIIVRVLEKLEFIRVFDRIEVVPDRGKDPDPFGVVVSPFIQTCLAPITTLRWTRRYSPNRSISSRSFHPIFLIRRSPVTGLCPQGVHPED